MDAIKKKMQAMKIDKDGALERALVCEQQARDANTRAEKAEEEARQLQKKIQTVENELDQTQEALTLVTGKLEEKNKALQNSKIVFEHFRAARAFEQRVLAHSLIVHCLEILKHERESFKHFVQKF